MGNEEITIINVLILFEGKIKQLKCNINITIKDLILQYIKEYHNDDKYDLKNFTIKIKGQECNLEKTLNIYKNEINNNCMFELSYNNNQDNDNNDDDDIESIDYDNTQGTLIKERYIIERKDEIGNIKNEYAVEEKDNNNNDNFDIEINIKFGKNVFNNREYNFIDLNGLLKLCLFKEIAISNDINNYVINNLPKHISNIISILKRGKINYKNVQEGILKTLRKIRGGNIINYSKYVNGIISQNDIKNYLIPKLDKSKKEIQYIHNCLGKYIEYSEKFEEEFERAKKDSVFEYSIISATIIERENIDIFEKNRKECPNRIDRVLFHGTSHDSISKILPTVFLKARCIQHGEGVYFTEDLDSCWIYGSEVNKNALENNRNLYIPQVGECCSFIASAVYYDKNGCRRVTDYKYNPQKNEINYAYAGMKNLESIKDEIPDKTKFYGSEFVVNDLDQICPFMSIKLKRDDYCIIWRDTNFSPNPVYYNEYDSVFKYYLRGRMEYINKMAKYNVYCCETSEEALNLIKRKKYNKIILISNIGKNLEGKTFIEEARNIIGNDVVVLFNAYDISHLDWVKNYKNAFFSNEPEFYEPYLECFYDKSEHQCKISIKKLKETIEKHYDVKFNFDDKFLDFPYTKKVYINKFEDLTF